MLILKKEAERNLILLTQTKPLAQSKRPEDRILSMGFEPQRNSLND